MTMVKGAYLGDVTALCFARILPDSEAPAVLAGTGAQVQCYSLETGKQYFSVSVFDGIRVHGICSAGNAAAAVAVHGERRVKLFRLSVSGDNEMVMDSWQTLPRFTKWVLDVRFLKKRGSNDAADYSYLAVGLSDNSVCLWDLSLLRVTCSVRCTENCLLYSMRMWGDTPNCLRVAAGTIFNEVVVWTIDVKDEIQEAAQPVRRFRGHEGSIYRISWSEDGELIGSVSDDRSARIWRFTASDTQTSTILFGHTARVWDLHLDDKVFITASEDCTCGVWSLDGELLKTLKGHVGRGVWRCIYDPHTGMLVTAGADASMKLYSLADWSETPHGRSEPSNDVKAFQVSFKKTEGHRDSKSEYVRCVRFTGPSSVLIGTNSGLLQHLELLETGDVERVSVFQTSKASPIVCMDLLKKLNLFIAIGDGQGRGTVLEVARNTEVVWHSTWSAEAERQLLGVFWSKNLDSRYVFTADPNGGLRCWLKEPDVDDSPRLLAYFKSSFCSRIVCMDASFSKQVLVCGDQKGNLHFFHFDDLLNLEKDVSVTQLETFRGVHGVSAAASVSISASSNGEATILSTGRDGCVCEMTWNSCGSPRASCSRVEKIAALTVIDSLIQLDSRRLAVGFAAADFVLWDITNEVELKRVLCGGWKRPHSLLLGDSPESQFGFAFVKDQELYIHRIWDDLSSSGKGVRQQALRKQFHGREIHTVLFLSNAGSDMDWLLTGSEDGTVQITRYTAGDLQPSASLEEHVGGSAVRALALSSHVYDTDGGPEILLFSAGAKEVLTCWSLSFESTDQISPKWLSTFNTRAAGKDDLRYLALTVFPVRNSKALPVYFVVAALSNAVLAVKAFVLSSKTWHHLAVLEHHSAPVLALHHAVLSDGARFLVFSGSTDGSLAVWDLTQTVDDFISKSESLTSSELELRPRSGRGSQGGKVRRHLRHQQPDTSPELSRLRLTEELPTVLHPVLVLPDCHQSGVNALYVSASSSSVFLVSGGDDQAIHFTELLHFQGTSFSISSTRTYENAHGSAVKGVWTDGNAVFSTGLDQRLRFWQHEGGELSEASSCVIDVPEAEALSVRRIKNSCYRVAVAGRGLQIAGLNLNQTTC